MIERDPKNPKVWRITHTEGWQRVPRDFPSRLLKPYRGPVAGPGGSVIYNDEGKMQPWGKPN